MPSFHQYIGKLGGQQMTDFEWLSSDKQVQRTEFGKLVEMLVNFGSKAYNHDGLQIPGRSVVARWIDTGKTKVFSVSSQ